jgi:putative transposase
MRRHRRRARPRELEFRSWGGPRRGAGRKRTGPKDRVSHRAREALSDRHPVHVTVRLREGLPSLRRDAAREAIERSFRAGCERFGFRLTQYSLQSNHVHLIAEAGDERALSRGMKGLLVRVARALNRLWARKGSVFADRYHTHPLRTPREVRAALAYVLHNARRHGLRVLGIDPYSSGRWFDGWSRRLVFATRSCAARAQSWLLRIGWRRHGRIGIEETPRASPP